MFGRNINSIVVTLFVTGLILSAPLFAAKSTNKDYVIKVKHSGHDFVRISNVHTRIKEGKFIVSGKVRRANSFRPPALGHIDISVTDTHQKTIADIGSYYTPRGINRKHTRPSHFKITLEKIPPKGSVIEVFYTRDKAEHHKIHRHDK